MAKAIWVFFGITLLDIESTTTSYPGARRATRLLTAIFSSAASGRESEKKLSQTLALQNLRKAKDVVQSVVMEEVVGSSPTRGAKKLDVDFCYI